MSPAKLKSTWESVKRGFKARRVPDTVPQREEDPTGASNLNHTQTPAVIGSLASDPDPRTTELPKVPDDDYLDSVPNGGAGTVQARVDGNITEFSRPPKISTEPTTTVITYIPKEDDELAVQREDHIKSLEFSDLSPRQVDSRLLPKEDEALAAQHKDYIENLGISNLYPRQVDCRLVLFFNRQGPVEYFEELQIVWQRQHSSRFSQIDKGARRFLSDKYGIKQNDLYRISGSCRLLRVDQSEEGRRETAVDTQILEKERQWSMVIQQMVGKFFSQKINYGKRCKLELRWEFSSLVIESVDGTSYSQAVRNAVREKMKQNFRNQDFLPEGDFHHIFNNGTVDALFKDDESLKDHSPYCAELRKQGKEFSLEEFRQQVKDEGTRLLAVCVYSQMPLECLHRFMSKGLKNSDLPLKVSDFPTDMHKLKNMDRFKCDDFRIRQGSFVPHIFGRRNRPPLHEQIDDDVVIPVIFDPSGKNKLGEGAFGVVYPARIYPGHHNFSANRDEYFALKRWKWWDADAEETFKKEEVPLQKLHNAKCGNVVLHLASWSQSSGEGRRFYMLFPKAVCNLSTFMRTSSPAQDKDHVSWLFRQLFELTDAVDQIHILSPLPHGPPPAELNPKQLRQKGGFHHDLKPANILAFDDPETGRPVFKITDFGVAKLDFMLASRSNNASFQASNFGGDFVYGAPDFPQLGRAGRKADIWSLGCCFLEILLWNFGEGGEKLEEFRFARYIEPPGNTGNTAAYWYYDGPTKTVALKPAVKQKLEALQRICLGKGQFQVLIREVEQMITLKPDERKSAANIRSAFKAMHQEVEVNLDEDPDYYKKVHHTDHAEAPAFAPVSATFKTPSRGKSIDTRNVDAPYGKPPVIIPGTSSDHHRSFSDPTSLRGLEIDTDSDTVESGAHFLMPPPSPNGYRSRTPSIEISDYSNLSPRTKAFIAGFDPVPSRHEIPNVQRSNSGSTRSSTV